MTTVDPDMYRQGAEAALKRLAGVAGDVPLGQAGLISAVLYAAAQFTRLVDLLERIDVEKPVTE